MLRSTSLHAYMFRSTCLGFYVMLSFVSFLFLLYVDDRVICSHTCHALLGSICSFCHVSYLSCRTCLYARIHVPPCPCAKFLHVCMHVSMLVCLDLGFHMLVCLDPCSLHVLCYFPCAYALYAMFVCLDLGYVCHAMRYCSPFVTLSFFLVFLA